MIEAPNTNGRFHRFYQNFQRILVMYFKEGLKRKNAKCLYFYKRRKEDKYYIFITGKIVKRKRLFDVFVSTVLLVILIPILFVLSVLIFWQFGAPILFRQARPGVGGKIFYIYKFRTMINACDAFGKPLADSKRLTPFGRFLRSTSLDELPGLWNVLIGNMSLVGPRPLLKEYLPLYSPEQARRHNIRPGITGWAQVNGRNAISWEEKFCLDTWYVDHRSFFFDIKILLITIKKVFSRSDVAHEGHSTMPFFSGSDKTS